MRKGSISCLAVESAWFNLSMTCGMEIEDCKKHMKDLDKRFKDGKLTRHDMSSVIYNSFLFYKTNQSLLNYEFL